MQLLSSILVTQPTWIFLVVLLVILFAPILTRRLHIPHIIGLILAGMLIGEHGFHIVSMDRSFEIFGQVGIYYIMFLAGLGLDMGSIAHYGRKGIGFGILTFIIPLFLGYLAMHRLLHFDAIGSVVVATIFSSHTLVSYPVLSRYGVTQHEDAIVSVIATAFTTFCSLVTLAIAIGVHSGEVTLLWGIIFFVKSAIYVAVVIVGFRYVGRWFLRKYDDQIMQFTMVLIMILLSAGMAELVGLAGLLGAFLCGLVVNRLVPRTSPLMNRIEFLGNALFIPYFLITVGMIINLRGMFSSWHAIWVAIVMVLVAGITKWIPAAIMSFFAKGTPQGRRLMFGLTSAHAAGALAIVMIATSPEIQLMDEVVFDGTIMLILVSCIVSGIATNAGARQLTLSSATTEKNRGASHGKCLVTYSQAESVEDLTQLAMMIRNRHIPDALMGLTVTYDDASFSESQHKAKMMLQQAQNLAAAADVSMQTMSRVSTNVASGILHTMREYDCGEIIVNLRDRETGMPKSSLGSVIDAILKGTHLEVLAVRTVVAPGTIRRIYVAVPEKAEYEVGFYKWLEHICRLAHQLDAHLVFHAFGSTIECIKTYLWQLHVKLRAEYNVLTKWSQVINLQQLSGINDMLIIVSSRPGFISYNKQMSSLPLMIHRYLSHTNVVLLYPDQGE